jgi:hypothetical protein
LITFNRIWKYFISCVKNGKNIKNLKKKEKFMKLKDALRIVPIFFLLLVGLHSNLSAQGHFELSLHYGMWTLDLLGNTIENAISDALETEVRDAILEEIQADYPHLIDPIYSQSLDFDSSGNNYGFEIRWYPGGQDGSFSLGFSLEKTEMEVELTEIASDMNFDDGSTFEGSATGDVILTPLTFHLSVRWDIVASSPVHPYITLGLGVATFSSIEDDEVSYFWEGELDVPGEPLTTYGGEEIKTIREIQDDLEEEDEDFLPLSVLPFIQLNLGLKGKITENIHLMVDAGIWNGFILRGGIALRL